MKKPIAITLAVTSAFLIGAIKADAADDYPAAASSSIDLTTVSSTLAEYSSYANQNHTVIVGTDSSGSTTGILFSDQHSESATTVANCQKLALVAMTNTDKYGLKIHYGSSGLTSSSTFCTSVSVNKCYTIKANQTSSSSASYDYACELYLK